jgi:alpha-1,2-mannosyltransferase
MNFIDRAWRRLRAGQGMSHAVFPVVLLALGAFHLFVVLRSEYWPLSLDLTNASGSPIGRDFLVFWTASSLALHGNIAAIYDPAAFHQAMLDVVPSRGGASAPWFYPPIFLLYVLPLALIPYLPSLFLWLAVPLGFLMRILRRLMTVQLGVWPILLFPGIGQSLAFGQNGILSAALLAGGFWALDRRPLLAGVLFGLLSYKPQLCVLLVPALFFGGYWRVILSMAVTISALGLATVALFGWESWHLFRESLQLAGVVLETRDKLWPLMVTIYASARLIGVAATGAQVLQGILALALLAATCVLWRMRVPLALKGSAIIAAMPLTTPYALNYDLASMILPIAWLYGEGARQGWLKGERTVLAIAWTVPMWGWMLAAFTDLLLTPVVLLALFAIIVRRALRTRIAVPAGPLAPDMPRKSLG